MLPVPSRPTSEGVERSVKQLPTKIIACAAASAMVRAVLERWDLSGGQRGDMYSTNLVTFFGDKP